MKTRCKRNKKLTFTEKKFQSRQNNSNQLNMLNALTFGLLITQCDLSLVRSHADTQKEQKWQKEKSNVFTNIYSVQKKGSTGARIKG